MIFRNHSNMLICCLRNISHYYQFWKQLFCFIFLIYFSGFFFLFLWWKFIHYTIYMLYISLLSLLINLLHPCWIKVLIKTNHPQLPGGKKASSLYTQNKVWSSHSSLCLPEVDSGGFFLQLVFWKLHVVFVKLSAKWHVSSVPNSCQLPCCLLPKSAATF